PSNPNCVPISIVNNSFAAKPYCKTFKLLRPPPTCFNFFIKKWFKCLQQHSAVPNDTGDSNSLFDIRSDSGQTTLKHTNAREIVPFLIHNREHQCAKRFW